MSSLNNLKIATSNSIMLRVVVQRSAAKAGSMSSQCG